MRKSIVIVGALFAAHLLFASSGHAEQLTVWGSTTCQKRFLEPNADALKKATGIELKVNGVGTGEGLLALLDGKTEVAAASEDLDLAIESAKKLRKNVVIPKNFTYHKRLF
jgi:phosphate transport system substrate-binding protein